VALRAAPDPFRCPELAEFYALALADGPLLLSTFRQRLGDERILDLVHDLLASKLEAILAADEPRAFFCTALQRRAVSWVRRGDAAVHETTSGDETSAPDDTDAAFVVDAKAALQALSPRDRAVAVAVALGDEREEIAVTMGTTKANVDQIVSRIRKRFHADG
jgi:DNA-directed RNA polymerase specialized sigma24 family protein